MMGNVLILLFQGYENEAILGFVYGVMVLLVLLYLFLAVVSQKTSFRIWPFTMCNSFSQKKTPAANVPVQ